MIDLSCLCGKVQLRTARRPDFIHACNCTLCSKSGAHWGYFDPAEVTMAGDTLGFSRADKDAPSAEIRFCATCGATTHFVLTEAAIARHGDTMMGVNMLLADAKALIGIELRYPDGRGWDGSGAFDYARPARVIGEG